MRISRESDVYVVAVKFVVKPGCGEAFAELIVRNARASRANELGCRQFDVTVAIDRPDTVFLYEVYDDRAAFDAHCGTGHYREFIAATASLVASKQPEFFRRIDPV
jgi:quinol monooxygenase YgiN